jgi:hypothetical protein
MRAYILLIALLATACAVSPSVTPYPIDAQPGPIDAPGPGPGEDASGPPDALPIDADNGAIDAPPPGPRVVGWDQPLSGSTVVISANTLAAFRLPTIERDAALLTWGVIALTPGSTSIRMALYRDRAGQPDDLVSATEPWLASEVEHPGAGETVLAGEYWLAVITDAEIEIRATPDQLVPACLRNFSFTAPFESMYGTPGACPGTDQLNVYIRVQE